MNGRLPVLHHFGKLTIRSDVDEHGAPWFSAADVCAALTIANSRDALDRLDDDEKGVATADTLGGAQEIATVNESGLYSLILTSRKPEAKKFKRWVTHEVLPSIRKSGGYSVRPSVRATTSAAVNAILAIGRAVACVPGVKPAIAMSMALGLIERTTGLPAGEMRKALPGAAVDEVVRLNATQLGQRFNPPRTAKAVNAALAALKLQSKDAREGWALTKEGVGYAEALPFAAAHGKHTGYQVLWHESVLTPLGTYFAPNSKLPGGQV